MNCADDETTLDLDDLRVPSEVREHGLRFRNPARLAVDLGNGEYLLYAEDGELLDLIYLRDDNKK